MNINGFSVDNLHQGDVRITGDLEVDGDMEIKGDVLYTGDVKIQPPSCLETDCIKSFTPATGIEINTEYKLPIVKGTIDQVLTQVDALGNCEFKDAGGGTGTARVITNKYYMVTPQPNTAWAYNTYQTIDSVGNGSKVIEADDFPTFAQIRIKAFGTWNITSTTPQVSPKGVLRLTFGTIQIELDDILIATLYTGSQNLNYVGGFNWNIYITRFSATLIKIAFTNETGTTIGPYYYVAPEHLSQSFDQYSLPTFPANIELEWKNTSALTTDPEIYPITGGYSIDIMNPTTDILTSTSSPATDHLTLANLNSGLLGDGGHVNAFLINGIKPMTGDIKMGNNDIIDANEIIKNNPSGADLRVENKDGPLVLSAQGGLSNIQITTPNNMILTNSNMEFFTNIVDCYGNMNMNGNQIQNTSLVSSNTTLECLATADLRLVGDTVDMAATNAITHAIGPTAKLTIDAVEITSFTDLNMDNNNIINVAGINNLTAVGGVYAGTSDGTLINNTVEQSVLPATSVGSLSIPADGFSVGDSFHCVVAGDCSFENKDEIQIKLKENGNILAQTPVFAVEDANAGDNAFEIEIDFTIRSIGATGSIATNFDFTYNKDGTDSKDFRGTRSMDVQPINTTTASTLEITVQFPTNVASSLQTRLFRLQKVY